VRVNTSQREQYRVTVHLFISAGCSPVEITFMPLTTDHKYDTSYWGLNDLFLFKSVPPFVSRRVIMLKLSGLYLRLVPSVCVNSHIIPSKVFLLGGPSVKKQTPNTRLILLVFRFTSI
jgi:hypothetical protein